MTRTRPPPSRPTGLPGLDRPLSQLVLGTMTFGDTVDVDTAEAMVDTALDAGITSLDTANGYAGGAPRRSSARSSPAGGTGRRSPPRRASTPATPGGARRCPQAGLRQSLEASLRRLRHRPRRPVLPPPARPAVPVDETLGALGSSSRRARSRASGCPTSRPGRSATSPPPANGRRAPSGRRAAALQPRRPPHRGRVRRVRDRPPGSRTIVYNPSGGGLLTGRHSFTDDPGRGPLRRLRRWPTMYKDRYWNDRAVRRIEALWPASPRRRHHPARAVPAVAALQACVVGASCSADPRPTSCRPTSPLPSRPAPRRRRRRVRRGRPALAGPMPGYNR